MVNTWLTRSQKILGSFDGQSGPVSAEPIRWMASTASETYVEGCIPPINPTPCHGQPLDLLQSGALRIRLGRDLDAEYVRCDLRLR
jgi:hypothetical protein